MSPTFLVFFGCATMFGSRTQVLKVETTPAAALLLVKYGSQVIHDGPAPWEGEVEKKFPVFVTASSSGYVQQEVRFRRSAGDWYRANLWILPFCWVGFLVDRSNGSAYKFVDPERHIQLVSEGEAAALAVGAPGGVPSGGAATPPAGNALTAKPPPGKPAPGKTAMPKPPPAKKKTAVPADEDEDDYDD